MDAQLDRSSVVALALERHHLAPGSAAHDPVVVARDLLGLHATEPFGPYLQLWARMDRFEPAMLEQLLYEQPRLARVNAMRATLFLEPTDLLPPFLAATRRVRLRGLDRYLQSDGLTREGYRRLAERIEATLAGRAMTARALRDELGPERSLTVALHVMCDEGRIVRWRPAGGRRDSMSTYRLFPEALPGVELDGCEEADAIAHSVDLYVRRYGPVTEADLAWWSGLDRPSLRAALVRLGDAVIAVGITGLDERFLIDRDTLATDRRPPEPHGWVSFLPMLDPYLMGYRDRARFLDRHRAAYVVDRGGNATSVILVDGRVAGVWDWHEAAPQHVRVHLFEPAAPLIRAHTLERGAELGRFLAGETVSVIEVETMRPLTERSIWVRSPLADPARSSR